MNLFEWILWFVFVSALFGYGMTTHGATSFISWAKIFDWGLNKGLLDTSRGDMELKKVKLVSLLFWVITGLIFVIGLVSVEFRQILSR